jgi:hypothetical protein
VEGRKVCSSRTDLAESERSLPNLCSGWEKTATLSAVPLFSTLEILARKFMDDNKVGYRPLLSGRRVS